MSLVQYKDVSDHARDPYWSDAAVEAEQAIADTFFRAQAAFEDAMRAFNRNSSLYKIDVQAMQDAFHDYLPSPDFITDKLSEVTPPQRN